jgi:hypothetical protein
MKTSTQLKALIRNLSKKSYVESETLLRHFMQERFLERIAVSDYRHDFILKGGMLIAAMVGIDTRTTMDMDATIKLETVPAEKFETLLTRGVTNTRMRDFYDIYILTTIRRIDPS